MGGFANYIVTVSATSNSTPDTEDIFVELKQRTGGSPSFCRVRRITVTCEAENSDAVTKIRIIKNSTAGSGGTGQTPLSKVGVAQQTSPIDNTMAMVKNGTTAFTPGTLSAVYSQRAYNGKVAYQWQAKDYDDEIYWEAGSFLCVMVACSAASTVFRVVVEFYEPRTFTVTVAATTNATPNTEDQFIEGQMSVSPTNAAGLKRFRITCDDASNAQIKGRLVQLSAAGSGGTSGSIVKRDTRVLSAAGLTANVKNGTSAFTVGTVSNTFDQFAFTARDGFEWVASDEREELRSSTQHSQQRMFALILQATQASLGLRCMVELEF